MYDIDGISFPDIVQPYYLPMASGKLRRSLSFEFSARDWTGAGFLMGKGIKMSVWKLVFKCSADISKLKGQIAASKLDLKREEELVTELRRRCFIDASMAKLELEKLRAAEMDGLESRLQLAEKKEITSMTHLQEYLRELLDTKRVLRSLKAELGKDVEQVNEESFERVNDLNEKIGKELIYQMADSEDERETDDRYASESDLREENVREYRHEKREKDNDEKEPEHERERTDKAKFEINSIVESYDVIRSKWESWHLADENDDVINYAGADESDENQNEKRGGCFGFLRRIFCCCKRKRAKREGRR